MIQGARTIMNVIVAAVILLQQGDEVWTTLSRTKSFSTIKDKTPIDDLDKSYNEFIEVLSTLDGSLLKKEAGTVDYAALTGKPGGFRGKPLRLKVLFLLSNPIRLDRKVGDIQFVHRTYLSNLSGSEGYVVDLLEPPPELSTKDPVLVDAVFYKIGTYEGRKGAVEAPFLIGKSLKANK
jgi:hypothetical protein